MSSSSTKPPAVPSDPKAVADGLAVLIAHTKKDLTLKREPPRLSHYRVVPTNLQTAYELLKQGATLVRATATKYALVGAIDTKDQGNLGMDLLRGCELIGAAAHVTMVDPNGCSLALRQFTQKAALSIFVATLRLVEAFHPQVVAGTANATTQASKENNLGAQKTGAVWEACDHILNKLLPQGNRNAMRRELFTWTRECNDSMEEFEELIELGPKDEDNVEEEEDEDEDYGAFGGGDDQYSQDELPLAQACWGLLKNSRGNMKIALESCEALGKLEQDHQGSDDQTQAHLAAIQTIHRHAKKVGEGVTDLGSLLYPPLLNPQALSELQAGVTQQVAFIVDFQDYLLGLSPQDNPLPPKVVDLANTLKTAAESKQADFTKALDHCQNVLTR